jgi:hypothetical protein
VLVQQKSNASEPFSAGLRVKAAKRRPVEEESRGIAPGFLRDVGSASKSVDFMHHHVEVQLSLDGVGPSKRADHLVERHVVEHSAGSIPDDSWSGRS